MAVNEEKRAKFVENAGKRVNNVLHDIQILEPMARSNNYDFTRADVEAMFSAMQAALEDAKVEFEKKFEENARQEKKVFSFSAVATEEVVAAPVEEVPVQAQEVATEETSNIQ